MSELPVGGTTGLCHESPARIEEAAGWLVDHREELRRQLRPIIPALRAQFGLTAKEAIDAARAAGGNGG